MRTIRQRKRLKASATVIVLILVFASNLNAGMFERGDAIYRQGSLPGSWFLGHAGLYVEWLKTGEPTNPDYQAVVEATKDEGVRYNTFSGFCYAGPPFWGVGYEYALTYTKRNTIKALAISQLGIPYDFFNGYKSPNVSFRCDGFIEWLYESVGFDIISDNSWDELWPAIQYTALLHRTNAVVEESRIDNPSDGDIIKGVVSVKAFISDGEKGSGTSRAKFYYYRGSEEQAHLIDVDDNEAVVSRTYSIQWDTSNISDGEYSLEVMAFDQAGNFKKSSKVKVYIDNTKPTVTNTKPSQQ